MEHNYGYPFGVAQAGLVEVNAGCSECQEVGRRQPGHIYCDPIEEDRIIVVGPILTNSGWKALVLPELVR